MKKVTAYEIIHASPQDIGIAFYDGTMGTEVWLDRSAADDLIASVRREFRKYDRPSRKTPARPRFKRSSPRLATSRATRKDRKENRSRRRLGL